MQRQVEACEARINDELDKLGSGRAEAPDDKRPRKSRECELRGRLKRMLGVDFIAIPTVGVETALTIAPEVGADLWGASWPVKDSLRRGPSGLDRTNHALRGLLERPARPRRDDLSVTHRPRRPD